ncbi:MAG: type II secretion system protein GspG [Gammaproteobacteria bacterium]|nr:type II secretion system protein GspG [Gammaproteobacteria bacterium]
MRKRIESGFTLIEVMVVVVILGILAAIVVPRIMSRPDEARTVKAQQDLRAIAAALDLYKLDNFSYPNTAMGLEALVTKPATLQAGANWRDEGYLTKIPTDPWGATYQYLAPGQHGDYDLYSLGADGVLGGEGVNQDLGNWSLE